MLCLAKLERARRLLERGLSQRKVALATGISRGTIGAVAKGKAFHERQEPTAGYVSLVNHGPVGRCKECGARVYLPCHECRVMRLATKLLAKRPTQPKREAGMAYPW
jgi:hypothetical protein